MFGLFKKKSKRSEKLYTDIPELKKSYAEEPSKLFIIECDLMDEFAVRTLCGNDGMVSDVFINAFDGPIADQAGVRLLVQSDQIIEVIACERAWREKDLFHLPENPTFKFGIIDVVTYPFFYALFHKIDWNADNMFESLWRINNNLVNEFFPSLDSDAIAISIFNAKERPVENTPVHNVFLFGNNVDEVKRKYEKFLKTRLEPIYVSRENSIMDDRYVLSKRRDNDGDPFDLSIIT